MGPGGPGSPVREWERGSENGVLLVAMEAIYSLEPHQHQRIEIQANLMLELLQGCIKTS